MDDFVFVSVAFGEKYVAQLDSLKESILNIYPDANLLFWRDTLPDNSSPFLESLYGFKVHAIKFAIDAGYKKILWLDPAMILMDRIDVLNKYSVAIVRDENKLSSFIWDKYLKLYNKTRKHLDDNDVRLVGGSLYYFNIENQKYPALKLIRDWWRDELFGYFGSQEMESSGQLNGHRADETCMAMQMFKNKIPTVSASDIKYCVGENPTFIKKHFK